MTRTLVTGAAGFTGRYLVERLAGQGHEVHALVQTTPDVAIHGAQQVHQADLADFEAVSAVVQHVRPEHVVHLAAIAFVAHGSVEEMYRSNILGTRQLLHALSLLPERPRSVLAASSANIYGNSDRGILREEDSPAPVNDYGATKLAAEIVASIYRSSLPIIIVRPFNYTGRGQSSQFLIPKIVDHVRRGASTIELGNLDVARDFSDVRTVVDAYSRLLNESQAIGGTFNICSGQAISLQQLVDQVCVISGRSIEVRVNPAFVRANEVRSLAGSRARLESVIGAIDRIPLEETLRWMLED